jgi:hypothetical protein
MLLLDRDAVEIGMFRCVAYMQFEQAEEDGGLRECTEETIRIV